MSFFSFAQTTYYVAKSGSNSNSGTSVSSPFLTISHAVSQINPGDQIFIRRGTYHEEIIINNIDSSSGNETLITNYNNEQVIIDGTINVTGQWIDDTIGGVGVKKVESFTESITQLFVGNDQMVMARWPNAQFSDLSIYDHDNWAQGEESGSTDGSFLIDETYENPGSLSLANSIGILNVGSFRTFNRNIATHTQQGGDDVITYTNPIGDNGIGAGLSNNGELKDKHHYFFFEGKKEFLDNQNEWFLDHVNDVLYLKPPNGIDLNNTPIRGKIRDYSISISGSEHLKINGLTFFATTIHTSGSKNIEISECNFYFPSHSRRMLGDLSGANVTTFGTGSGNTARVDSSIVSGCLFINTEGEALVIKGNNNTIKNSYFRNIDWSATELNGLMVSVFVDGTSNTFTGNEMYHTGASATVWPGEQSIFSYNIVSSTGHAQSDGSVFQGTKNYVFGSEVHHNFVYDTEKYAFRYDAPGGDAAQAGSFGVMHHNIADNTLGLMIKGNNQIIAHNTVINTINNRNDIIILAEDCSNTNTWMYNNLAERIGSHRSDVLFSAPSNGPIPIGTEGYIKNGNNWEVCDSNDGALYSGTGTGSSTANMDAINQSRPGISYNANVESLINYNPGNGKTISDYQPTSNQIIDQGVALTNTVSISLGQTNQLNLIVPHTPVGAGTDIGAIDGNSLWTPGVQGWTPQQNINLEDIFYDPGIVSSNLLLHLDFANSTSYSGSGNDVYDLSDNYNHGVLNGNPNMLNNTGGEIDLDGTNDYIQLNDPFSHQDHTIEIWLKMKETSSGWIWDARDADNDGYILFNREGVGNSFNYFINTNDLDSYSQQHTNEWVQVIATHNSNKSKIFVNGQKVADKNVNKNINTTRNVRIGTRSWGNPDYHLKAEIGIVRYYNKAFYSDDVLQNYNANAARFGLTSNPASPTSIDITQPIPTRGLKLYLDSANSNSYPGNGNTWSDLSGNNYDFTIGGNPPFIANTKQGVIDFQAPGDFATNNSDPIINVNSYTKFTAFYPKSPQGTNNIISGGTDSKHVFWMNASNNTLYSGHQPPYDSVEDQPNGGGSILNSWNLGAVTFDTDTGFELYHDGNLVDTNTLAKAAIQQSSPLVNIARFNNGNYFNGFIPVVIIYDRKLSQNEINSLSNHFAPRYSLSPTNTMSLTIDEGVAMGTVLANLSATDSDSTEFTYSFVSGNGTNDQHNSSFTISGTQVVTNNIISFDNTPVMNINLKVEDESNNSFTSSFVVYVNDLNRTPTDIGVSSLTFPESISASSTIATLSAVDSDTSDTHVFSLINGNGSNDADNSSFTVSGTSLIINSTADYESKAAYNIYLNVFDGENNFAKAFTVSVTNVNESPSNLGFLSSDLAIPTNGLILHLDTSNSDSYPGNGNTWFDLSGQNAHAEATTLPAFGLNGAQIKNFDFNDNSHGFNSVDLSQEYRDLIIIKKYEIGGGGIKTVFGHYNFQDDSFRINGNQIKVQNTFDANDWQFGSTSNVFVNGSFITQNTTVLNQWVFVRTYRSNNVGFGNSFRYEISKGHGGGSRSYRGKINLILAYNRKLTNQEVQNIYQRLSPRLNGTETSLTVSSTSSQTSIDEEVSIGTEAGKLTATDSDTTNLTYSLVSGNGTNDQHNSLFTVSGTQLIVAGNIDYETNATLNIYVQVSDGENTYQKAMTVTVNDIKETPSINVSNLIKIFDDDNFDLSATSSSTGAFTYTVTDQNVATVNGNTATIVGAGSTSITVTQAEDNNFAAATATFTLTVNKADPPISFTDISKTYGDANFNLSASSSSTGAFTYTIADQNIATINGVAVSIESAGSTSITITQAADNNYNTASKTINLLIYKAIPIIIASNVTKTFGDLDFNLTATSSSTGAFTFNILDTNIATVTGSNTTIVGAGTTTVTVNQVADSNYYAAIATMTLTVDKADPGIGNFSPITKTFGDQSFEIIEPSKNSNNTSDFIYSSSNPLIASVTGKIITLHKAGLVSITANLPADNNFIASSVSTTLTINKANQSISIGELPTTLPLKDFNSISLTASSTSGSPVSMSLANGSAASLNGAPGNYSLVSIQQTGLVTITFFVSENSSENYKAATVTLVVDVVKVNQNISLNTAPPNFLSFSENLSFTIDASSSSSLPISYNILSGNALINSNVLSVTGVGQIIIQLSQQGNNEFNPAPLSNFTLNVGQGNTLLSEFNISEKFVNDSPFDITPPNSNRSGEIVYTSSNPQIATISGTKITILNIGQTTITANQIATNNYKSGTISSVFIVNQIINPDFDNDGIDDPYDNCYSVPNPDQNDNDGDGIGDSCDNDDDNDGVDDLLDNCRNESNSSQDDFDNDGIGDKCDIDDDNDGYNDIDDVFPLDENEWADFDQDGIGNNEDKDDDNDNWSDEIETLCNTNPFDTQNYPGDYDSDLTPDCIDEDLDNDGYNNDLDVFPYDSSEWSDNDKDSIGDNADLDDDNDNWTDLEEIECLSDPLDSDSIPEDFDQDGDPNCFDLDDDNDGYNDTFDAFPFDSSEWSDTDLDGVGDNSDNDFNGDGLVDDKLFPTEFISPNGDGINDSWVIVNSEFFPNCEVWIYTRMGQLIYNSKRYNNDWSGLYNGQPLPESSYVYLIDKNGDGEIDQKGWIYIAR